MDNHLAVHELDVESLRHNGDRFSLKHLADTPNTLTGEGGKVLQVNAGGSAIEFADASGGVTATRYTSTGGNVQESSAAFNTVGEPVELKYKIVEGTVVNAGGEVGFSFFLTHIGLTNADAAKILGYQCMILDDTYAPTTLKSILSVQNSAATNCDVIFKSNGEVFGSFGQSNGGPFVGKAYKLTIMYY